MATYYVRKTGSDAAAGTSAGTAWATLTKVLGQTGSSSAGSATTLTTSGLTTNQWVGAVLTILTGTGAGSIGTVTSNTTTVFTVGSWSGTAPSGAGTYSVSGISSGDTVYVGAGTYREVVSIGMTSATVETKIIGDMDGAQTGDAGEVKWSAYTTNDTTTPSTSSLCNLNTRDFLTFQNIWFVGGNLANGRCVTSSASAGASHSKNITFKNCFFQSGATGGSNTNQVFLANGAQEASVWTFDRCAFFGVGEAAVWMSIVQFASGADWDEQIVFTNCLFMGCAPTVQVNGSANTFKPGGIKISYCTFYQAAFNTATNAHSTTVASDIEHCFIVVPQNTAPISAGTAGQLVREDYNTILSTSAVSANVTSGGNSTTYAGAAIVRHMAFDFGQSWAFGQQGRPFFTPWSGSNLLGVGTGGNISAQTVDFLNRPRPSGGASANAAAGMLERHDFAISPGTTVGADSGTGYIELVGMGDHDFDVPVDAVAQTFTIKTKTSGYTGTNYPQMKIVNGGQAGVADASVDATNASASAYESISIGPFTPTSKGVVTVRLTNRSANGTGIAAFDTFAVS